MADDWIDDENDAIVADYFAMLADDVARRSAPAAWAGRWQCVCAAAGVAPAVWPAAPVLSAYRTVAHDAADFGSHAKSAAGYKDMQNRLELFILKWKDEDGKKQEAINELEEIIRADATLIAQAITLNARAIESAKKALQEETRAL